MKKDGTIGKQKRICKACRGKGVVYIRQKDIAGFKMNINSVDDITVHGFKTDKHMIDKLVSSANSQQKIFIESYSRYNAIKTYLKTFIDGIEKGLDKKDKIHPQYMQCVTSTGRLSSRNPNFQNMPRGGTFPVRKVVVSRWQGGYILEGDYSQLEFRVAGFLSKDQRVYEDVKNDVDVHAYTASILGVSRQDAKADTFKPLYGGLMGTPKQVEYYRAFKNKYKGVTKWHEELCNEAVTEQQITLPNGRHFAFENTYRLRHGGVTNSTSIKNYPVQGFATADLLPIALVYLKKMLTKNTMQSIICNTVHDSIVLDVYPSEKELAIEALKTAMLSIKSECIRRYDIEYDMPIGIELKIGYNWLDQKGVLQI
jgi:DNA polymerase I-like protein with 3'-5' exonuclease and polymerase domains